MWIKNIKLQDLSDQSPTRKGMKLRCGSNSPQGICKSPFTVRRGQVYRWPGASGSFSGLERQPLEFRNAKVAGVQEAIILDKRDSPKFSIQFLLKEFAKP